MASPSALLVHPHPKCKFALSVLPSPPPLEMSRRDSHGLSHAPKSGRGFPLPAVKLVDTWKKVHMTQFCSRRLDIGHQWPFRHLFSRWNLLRLSRLGVGRFSGGTSFILTGWFWHQFPWMLSTESGPSDVSFPTCVASQRKTSTLSAFFMVSMSTKLYASPCTWTCGNPLGFFADQMFISQLKQLPKTKQNPKYPSIMI